jgi:Tfp pilus assembly protein PilV
MYPGNDRAPARTQGFTLVEVMMAASVMMLGIVGIIGVLVSGSEMLDVSRKQTIAMQIIHGQLDILRTYTWPTISSFPASKTVTFYAANQSSIISAGFVFGDNLPALSRGFTCTRTVATVRTNLKQVTFSVTWLGNTGRSYTRSGSTFYGKNGLYVTYERS